MAAYANISRTVLIGSAWTGTGPGLPGTQTVSGTITSSTDISAFLRAADHGTQVAALDGTNFGSGGFLVQYPGIKSGDDIVFDVIGDYAASQIYATLNTLGGVGAYCYLDMKPTSAARAATNPSFVAYGFIKAWQPVRGTVGELAMMGLTVSISGKFADLAS